MKRFGGFDKKRKDDNFSYGKFNSFKLFRRCFIKLLRENAKWEIFKLVDYFDDKKIFGVDEVDFIFDEGVLRKFISIWKDFCKELSILIVSSCSVYRDCMIVWIIYKRYFFVWIWKRISLSKKLWGCMFYIF